MNIEMDRCVVMRERFARRYDVNATTLKEKEKEDAMLNLFIKMIT